MTSWNHSEFNWPLGLWNLTIECMLKKGIYPTSLVFKMTSSKRALWLMKNAYKKYFYWLSFFSLTKTMLDITCWTSYEEMQISLPAYALFYIISLSFCKKLFNKQKNTIYSKGPKSKLPCYHFWQTMNEKVCLTLP